MSSYVASGELSSTRARAAALDIAFGRSASGGEPPDEVRYALMDVHEQMVSNGFQLGSIDWDRMLEAFESDAASSRIYIVPTSHGWVCYALPKQSARCVPSLAGGISWSVASSSNADGTVTTSVHGIAANDVARIAVVFDDGKVLANLDGNAFRVVQRARQRPEVVAFELEWKDGRHTVTDAR